MIPLMTVVLTGLILPSRVPSLLLASSKEHGEI
jgi:hypothetical protein